jgi:hypothetical protein
MNTKLSFILFFAFFIKNVSLAQVAEKNNAYWVFFADKKGVQFDPYTYFHNNTIERRLNAGIALADITDYPLNEKYVSSISLLCDSITIESRWMNAVKIWGSNANELQQIKSFAFVKEVEAALNGSLILASNQESSSNVLKEKDLKLASQQLNNLGVKAFQQSSIAGKGVRVAVFDAGFPGLDKHEAFEKHRLENRIVETWNFLKKNHEVYQGGTHGTMTTGCVAGVSKDIQTGLATDCELLLALTEFNIREPFKEEEYWLAAAEWADKNGADIISSSLGYSFQRYFYKDMNGQTSLVSKAARMAIRKGI